MQTEVEGMLRMEANAERYGPGFLPLAAKAWNRTLTSYVCSR